MGIGIAMWSGPRNISTAMMRSWENRPDTQVLDEPFYAYFLKETGLEHPGALEVLASQPNSWQEVVPELVSEGEGILFQKHMTKHMLSDIDLGWTQKLKHFFLIRDPKQVVASFAKKVPNVTVDEVGIKRQYELYQEISDIVGCAPAIIDARDLLTQPHAFLETLCGHLNIPFYEQMLKWPPGARDSDGVWAKYWYHSVETSTGFTPFQEPQLELNSQQQDVVQESLSFYQALHEKRLQI